MSLVLGGIRSGKSQWAEDGDRPDGRAGPAVRYLATGAATADDADWSARVATHRERRPAHWTTVESQDVATQLRADPTTCRRWSTTWAAGWSPRWTGAAAWTGGVGGRDVDDLVDAVGAFRGPLALVSPEVGLAVVPATESGRRFADELGALNQRLAAQCERVVLVIAGQPLTVKETT